MKTPTHGYTWMVSSLASIYFIFIVWVLPLLFFLATQPYFKAAVWSGSSTSFFLYTRKMANADQVKLETVIFSYFVMKLTLSILHYQNHDARGVTLLHRTLIMRGSKKFNRGGVRGFRNTVDPKVDQWILMNINKFEAYNVWAV